MANSTTNLDLVLVSQASKEVTVNNALDAASNAMTYGRRGSTSSGLVWGFFGGNVIRPDGSEVQIANGTVALTASTTNYVVALKSTGAVSVSNTTTNWNNQVDYWRLYSIVTGAATVTSYTDARRSGWNQSEALFWLAASVAPTVNGQMVFELTDNSTVTIKVRGLDGTTRSATIALT